ncbi:MAG TPA: CHAT domain-containing tetratricopeptide repeat protein [Candidatus Angelobacter sp.]
MRFLGNTFLVAVLLVARTLALASEQNGSALVATGREGILRKAEIVAEKASGLRHKQNRKDLDAAIGLFQESARLFKAAHSYAKTADINLQLGEIYFDRGNFERALASYHDALTLAGDDRELRCRALSHIARTHATKGDSVEADKFSEQALSLVDGVSPNTQAQALEARGEALFWPGDSLHALELFSRAADLFSQAKDDEGQALALLMQAWARHRAGEVASSRKMARRALQLWYSQKDSYGVAQAYAMLGSVAIMAGEFGAAQCEFDAAQRIFQRIGDKDNEGIVLNSLGYTQWQSGDLQGSLESYQQAKVILSSHGLDDKLATAEAITGIARALIAKKQYRQLLPLYTEKSRLARQANNQLLLALALADLAGVYERKGDNSKARALYEKSLEGFRALKDPYREGDLLIRLAVLFSGQRKYSQAIDFLERAKSLKGETAQPEDTARINYELADVYRHLNRLAEARPAIEKTIEIIESQRLKITNFDSRAVYFASLHRYFGLYIELLMGLHQQDPQSGFMQLAFEAAEKSKVRALLDLLNQSTPGAPCSKVLQGQLDNSTDALAAADEPASKPPVLTMPQIQAEIGADNTVLLEYALGDEKSYVWVVDQTHAVVHELPPAAKIAKLVRAFGEAVTARQPRPEDKTLDEYHQRVRRADAAYQSDLRQLSSLLLPADDLAGAKRLLIVPDGSLQYLPFAALLVPGTNGGKEVLVSHREVVVLPSGSALKTLREAAAKRPPPTSGAAIFADPVFEPDDPRLSQNGKNKTKRTDEKPATLKIALRDVQGSQHIDRLAGSRVEAENIRKTFRKEDVLVAEDFRASKEYVLHGVLEHYRFLHFATHGIIDPLHPEMSGLILSLISRSGKHQDGYLRLGDIYKLKLSADLVVLSACKSALGKDLESEGIIGLPRGFLYAGARSVIASLWKVDDEATAAFMKGFYARIQRGESPSSALRLAQIGMVHSTKWSAPFYWAAFVLQGDYK